MSGLLLLIQYTLILSMKTFLSRHIVILVHF